MYQKVFELHADLLKVLAHPRRLEIINLLREQELSVSGMQSMLGLPQANLSQHLMLLRRYGVVDYRKEGKRVFYKIAHQNFVRACDLLRSVLVERYDADPIASELTRSMAEFLPVVTDPVCGMRLPIKSAAASSLFAGQRYYFCATGCKKKFRKAAGRYAPRARQTHGLHEMHVLVSRREKEKTRRRTNHNGSPDD